MIYCLHGVTVGLSPDLTRYFGEGNLANYSNSEANEIIKELYNISDESILKEKYKKLQEIYLEERPYIGLHFNRLTTVYGKGVNASMSNNWFDVFYNIENWHSKN